MPEQRLIFRGIGFRLKFQGEGSGGKEIHGEYKIIGNAVEFKNPVLAFALPCARAAGDAGASEEEHHFVKRPSGRTHLCDGVSAGNRSAMDNRLTVLRGKQETFLIRAVSCSAFFQTNQTAFSNIHGNCQFIPL